jgi:hypothetical protein
MKIHRPVIFLHVILVAMVTNADDDVNCEKSSWDSAYKAMQKNDCRTAIYCLEKFKHEEEPKLEKQPDILKKIDAQIAECQKTLRGVGGTTNLWLKASNDTKPVGAGDAPVTGTLAVSGFGFILVLILLHLL